MKSYASISLLAAVCVVSVGCGTVTHKVDRTQLVSLLASDTQAAADGKAGYQWSYVGSRNESHYFRRQLLAMFRAEVGDGFYAVAKTELDIGSREFPRPKPDNSALWIQAFTQKEQNSPRRSYSIDYGIGKWTPLQQRLGEQDTARNP